MRDATGGYLTVIDDSVPLVKRGEEVGLLPFSACVKTLLEMQVPVKEKEGEEEEGVTTYSSSSSSSQHPTKKAKVEVGVRL